uniref:Uncharacterized protein n=1 Tax=Ditylenchus dipsaci TaxID=166011 RepID=A0A915EC37_9BILA
MIPEELTLVLGGKFLYNAEKLVSSFPITKQTAIHVTLNETVTVVTLTLTEQTHNAAVVVPLYESSIAKNIKYYLHSLDKYKDVSLARYKFVDLNDNVYDDEIPLLIKV